MMIVRKVRGQNKLHPIILTKVEYELLKRLGVSVEGYINEQIRMVAKQRRWKWWFEKQKEKST